MVDDTVHLLSEYLRGGREQGLDSHDAVRYAFVSEGVLYWSFHVCWQSEF